MAIEKEECRFIILTHDSSVVRDTETGHNYHTNSSEEAGRLKTLLDDLMTELDSQKKILDLEGF